MMKKSIGIIFGVLLLMPGIGKAMSITSPADFLPNQSGGFIEFQYTKKTQDVIDLLLQLFVGSPFIEPSLQLSSEEKSRIQKDPLGKIFFSQLQREGNLFYIDLSDTGYFPIIRITEEEWQEIIAPFKKPRMYKGIPVYSYTSIEEYRRKNSLARLGDFLVAADSSLYIRRAIDTALDSDKSFSHSESYKEIYSSFFPQRIFSFFVRGKEAINDRWYFSPANDAPLYLSYFFPLDSKFLETIGVSVAEDTEGYSFKIKALADKKELSAAKMTLNASGNFTTNLYKKLPSAKPIFYAEGFNPAYSPSRPGGVFSILRDELGNFRENSDKFLPPFTQEFAFAIQYDESSKLPHVTLLGNVSEKRKEALQSADLLVKLIMDDLTKYQAIGSSTKNKIFTFTKKIEGSFTKIAINLGQLGEITATIGISDDGLFIASTYPNIEQQSVRTGLENDPYFSSFDRESFENSEAILYVSLRNTLSWLENLALQKKSCSPLDFYRSYHSIINDELYKWRDVLLVRKVRENDAEVTGKFIVDSAKRKPFEEIISELKAVDKDSDGVSDLEEQFIYNTSTDKGDSDSDGVSDIEELKIASNPHGNGRLFRDVPRDKFFTEAVAVLAERGAVKGYSDGSFRPGKLLNRAEFVAMLVNVFKQPVYEYQGTCGLLSLAEPEDFSATRNDTHFYTPFSDIKQDDWYAKPIEQAHQFGYLQLDSPMFKEERQFTQGYSYSLGSLFEPSRLISRAEAVSILARASESIRSKEFLRLIDKEPIKECNPEPFTDIKSTDWFCGAVKDSFEIGVTHGKSETLLKPDDPLTRAEAATIIYKAIQADFSYRLTKDKLFEGRLWSLFELF